MRPPKKISNASLKLSGARNKHVSLLWVVMLFAVILGCTEAKKTADQPQRPNILFMIMDDASFIHFGAYGSSWVNTPNIDRVAKEGILFTNAYTPNAKCGPSRSAVLTGRNSWQLEEAANHVCVFPQKFKTYTESLADHGYFVGFTGKGWAPGDPGEIDGQPRELTGPAFNQRKLESPTSGISSDDYASNFSDFLDSNQAQAPFLFWFGAREPHRVYEYGSGISVGNKKPSDVKERYPIWPENDSVTTDLLDYAFEIEHVDKQLGLMLAALEKRNLLENTLIMVTSDNGMPFPRIKGQEYELSNHMPLVAMWPKGIAGKGRKVDDFVSFIDLAPTFLELAGVSQVESGMQPIQGKSLTDLFYAEKEGLIDPQRDHVLIGKERHDVGRPKDAGYPIRGIVKGDYLFIQNFETDRWPAGNPETGYLNCDGGPTKTICLDAKEMALSQHFWERAFGKRPEFELYNIQNDLFCIENLANNKEYAVAREQLKAQLYQELKEQQDPRLTGNPEIFDSYQYSNPNGVNFYERYMSGEKMKTSWVNPSDFRPLEKPIIP